MSGIEVSEEIVHLLDGDAEAGLADLAGLRVFENVAGKIEPALHLLEPVLVLEPIFERAVVPAADVVEVEAVTGLAKLFNDVGVAEAVAEELVDEIADGLSEVGDFAWTASAVAALD